MTGYPNHFNLEAYYQTIVGLINSDEVETALFLINNPPAYFRDHPPQMLTEIKTRLHKQLWTPCQYRGIYKDVVLAENDSDTNWPLRGQVIEKIVRDINSAGQIPNIFELAGGSKWLPKGLEHKGVNFFYKEMSLDGQEGVLGKSNMPNIFVCLELIEHLHNPWEIYQNYLKFDKAADIVVLSTPLYCYGGGMPNWENRELGHLRTYVPSEFHAIASKMFQGYEWTMNMDDVMVLTGRKK